MINLEIFGRSDPMAAVAAMLDGVHGVSRVWVAGSGRSGST
jgi:hypothetical protein